VLFIIVVCGVDDARLDHEADQLVLIVQNSCMLLCFADLQAVEIVLYSIVGSFSRDTCGC